MGNVLEIQLLRNYRRDLEENRQQVRVLNARAQALVNAISSLEGMLRLHGIDPAQIDDGGGVRPNADPNSRKPPADGIMGAVVAVIREARTSLGAKEVQRRLHGRGVITPYHALYRNMKLEADRPTGALVKHGERFGLRENAPKEGNADLR